MEEPECLDADKLEAINQQMKKDLQKRRQSNTKYQRMMVSHHSSFAELCLEPLHLMYGHYNKLHCTCTCTCTLMYLLQEFRQKLPSWSRQGEILQLISDNQVVVLSGETGCGKTTQVDFYFM